MKLSQNEKFIVVKSLVEYWKDCDSEDDADDIIKLIIKICEVSDNAKNMQKM